MPKTSEKDKAEALETLSQWLKPGDTVFTVLDHVSRSGMQRHIRLVLIKTGDNGQPVTLHPNWSAAKLLGLRQAKGDGLIVGGCGMDMGFHVVYELSARLYREGFGCIGKGCPSNDHSNGDRDCRPHGAFAPEQAIKLPSGLYDVESQTYHHWHKDGGCALKHQWI